MNIKTIDRLKKACEKLKKDLLERAEVYPGSDVKVVNVSNSIWVEFKESLDMLSEEFTGDLDELDGPGEEDGPWAEGYSDRIASGNDLMTVVDIYKYLDLTPQSNTSKAKTLLGEQVCMKDKAIGWYTEDYLTDKSATTYDRDVMKRWVAKGWPVSPLYALPQPQKHPSCTECGDDRVDIALHCVACLNGDGWYLTSEDTQPSSAIPDGWKIERGSFESNEIIVTAQDGGQQILWPEDAAYKLIEAQLVDNLGECISCPLIQKNR